MITPEYLNKIMYAVEDSLIDFDNRLIKQIVERILASFKNNNGKLFIPSTINDMRKLMDAGVLYSDIEKIIESELPGIQKEVKRAFLESAQEIMRQNNDFARQIVQLKGMDSVKVPLLEQVGIVASADELQMTAYEIYMLEEAYKRTNGTIRNLTRTTANRCNIDFVEACDKAYMNAQHGMSIQKAISDAIKDVADKGVSVVSYGGRQENIEVAIARAVRTGVNQSNADIVLTRNAQMGVSYVKTSSHFGARVTKVDDYTNHSWWQGRVYYVDWSNPVFSKFLSGNADEGFEWLAEIRNQLDQKNTYNYPDFYDSCRYGDIEGICGINCRHSFYPFYPGIQTDDDSRPNLAQNEQHYKDEQKLRAMEREIRKTKRELEAYKVDKETFAEEIKACKSKLQNQSDAYMDFCKKTGLKPRNMALQIK